MKIVLIILMLLTSACSSVKSYENESFPDSKAVWNPINPENFSKTEAQRIYEGSIGK